MVRTATWSKRSAMAIDWDKLVIGPTVGIFGDRVRYSTRRGAFDVQGVFDESYLAVTPLGRGGVDTEVFTLGGPGAITEQLPVLGVQLSQFPIEPDQDDVLTVLSGKHRGETFIVKEVQPDGHGHAVLTLNVFRG